MKVSSKQKEKKKKGFSLTELLAAVTILGIISLIAVVIISGIIKKAKENHYKAAEKNMTIAGQSYVQQQRDELPKAIGQKTVVSLQDLVDNNYIKPIKDYNGNQCDLSTSYVQIYKYSKNDYSYLAYLDCPNYKSDQDNNYYKPTINITLEETLDRNSKATIKITDDNRLMSYSYIIYKDDAEIINSGNIQISNHNVEFTKTINLNEYTPGKIKIVVSAINIYGNETIKKQTKVFDDTKGPMCIIAEEDSNPKEWINSGDRTITIKCDDGNNGTGCKQETYTKTFSDTTKNGIISIYDKKGNKTDCSVSVYIDKDAPTCSVKGGSSEWINASSKTTKRTITATCKDEGSGCKVSELKMEYTGNINTKKAGAIGINQGGYVEDNAGNRTNCPANQTVKIDKEYPICKVSGGNSTWTNKTRTIIATCEDGVSLCKTESFSKKYDATINTTKAGAQGEGKGGYVEDNAGNRTNCVANQTVKIDKEPPKCSVSGGSTKWINATSTTTKRTIIATCSDTGGSKCKKTSFEKDYTENIETSTAGAKGNNSGGYVEDNAGNKTNCAANQTVKIDKEYPRCKVSGGNESWINAKSSITSRKIQAKCEDDISGCKTATFYKIYSSNINTTTAGAKGNNSGGSVTDNAGNTTSCAANQTVRIDKDNPTLTVKLNNGNYKSGTWTYGEVTRYILGKDPGGSGIKEYQYVTGSKCTGTPQTENMAWIGNTNWKTSTSNYACHRVVDNAGNYSSWVESNIKIDTTPPTNPKINLSSTKEDDDDITFTITAGKDDESGISQTEYSYDQITWTKYTKTVTLLSKTGVKTVYARTKNNAEKYSDVVSATGYCDKDAVTVARNDNKPGGFRLKLTGPSDKTGIISNKYEYAYWNIESTNDTSNKQSGSVSTYCGNTPVGKATIKTTTNGITEYIPQYTYREYYCFAVRPYRSTEIPGLNRWTVQRKHAQGQT